MTIFSSYVSLPEGIYPVVNGGSGASFLQRRIYTYEQARHTIFWYFWGYPIFEAKKLQQILTQKRVTNKHRYNGDMIWGSGSITPASLGFQDSSTYPQMTKSFNVDHLLMWVWVNTY